MPNYPGGLNVITEVLKNERGRQKRVRRRCDYSRKTQRDGTLLALKMEAKKWIPQSLQKRMPPY